MNRIDLQNALSLYLVTDRRWLGKSTLEQAVEQAILGGVSLVQLREKGMPQEEFLRSAFLIKKVTDRYGVPLIINDNCRIAKKVDAAGVHLGQKDGSISEARALLGPHKIIGASARTLAAAQEAQRQGADYLGCGAVFATSSKPDAQVISHEILAAICAGVNIPVVAIGGVSLGNAARLKGSGVYGFAVISSLLAAEDIQKAAQAFRSLCPQTPLAQKEVL